MWVVEGLVRGIVEGSLGLCESSGKNSHTVSHSFLNSFSIRLSIWLAWKEKGSDSSGCDRWIFVGGAGIGDVSWVKS